MVDYYKEKRAALVYIDGLIAEQTPIEIVYYMVSTKFGFGKKFVDLRYKELENMIKAKQIEDVFAERRLKSKEKDLKSKENDQKSEENDLDSEAQALISGIETVEE